MGRIELMSTVEKFKIRIKHLPDCKAVEHRHFPGWEWDSERPGVALTRATSTQLQKGWIEFRCRDESCPASLMIAVAAILEIADHDRAITAKAPT